MTRIGYILDARSASMSDLKLTSEQKKKKDEILRELRKLCCEVFDQTFDIEIRITGDY